MRDQVAQQREHALGRRAERYGRMVRDLQRAKQRDARYWVFDSHIRNVAAASIVSARRSLARKMYWYERHTKPYCMYGVMGCQSRSRAGLNPPRSATTP